MTAATISHMPSRGLGTLAGTEFKLFLRDPGAVFFALAFPTVVLLGIGYLIPGAQDLVTGVPGLEDVRVVHLWGPVVLATAIATTALVTLPSFVAGYREQGIFKRLSTTPMRPGGVLFSHMLVSGTALVAAVVLAMAAGMVAFDLRIPDNWPLLLLVLVLATVAMFSIGMIIAGLAPKASTASAIGTLVYFPMLFFAGMWMPLEMMPDLVATIASWTPLGAASIALNQAWFGTGVPWFELAVVVGYAVVAFPLAVRLFRWEA
ncbi:ABC transporter permease [Tessaracoccus terricola]